MFEGSRPARQTSPIDRIKADLQDIATVVNDTDPQQRELQIAELHEAATTRPDDPEKVCISVSTSRNTVLQRQIAQYHLYKLVCQAVEISGLL